MTTRHPRLPFAGLVTGYFVSQVGTAMTAVALPWLVLETTGSALSTGIVGFAEMAPYVVMLATAGPLADRLGHRRTTVVGNTIAGVLVCLIPALHTAGLLTLPVLAILVAVAGATRGAADAAMSPLVPATARLGGIALERAAGVYSGANRAGLLIGMPVAGLLIGLVGPARVLLLDGLSFLLAALCLAVAVPRSAPTVSDAPATVRRYLADLRDGAHHLARERIVAVLCLLTLTTNTLDQAFTSVLLPVWVREAGHPASVVGAIGLVSGLGALVGIAIGAWIGPRVSRRMLLAVGFGLGAPPPFLVMALTDRVTPTLVVWALCSLASGTINPVLGAILYERVPEELQARVLGMVRAVAWTGLPLGSLVGGAVGAALEIHAGLGLLGLVMLAVCLLPALLPIFREVDRRPDAAAPVSDPAPQGDPKV